MAVTLTIDNRVRVEQFADLDDEVIADLKETFEHPNPDFYKRARMGLPMWGIGKTIRMWEQVDDRLEFPRGGLTRIIEVLAKHDLDRHFVDKRTEGAKLTKVIPDHKVTLWKNQKTLLEATLKKQQCILKSSTGSGKTSSGFAIAAHLKLPTLVIVPSGALFKQWIRRAQKELGMRVRDIGIIRGGTCELKALTIAMQQSLARGFSQDIANFFGVVIVDEVQMAAARTFIDVIDRFPAKYRVGISADHRRKDKKEFLIVDLFGAVAAEIDRAELIAAGVIVDTEIRVIPTNFEAPWYGVPETNETDDPTSKFWDSAVPKTKSKAKEVKKPETKLEIDWDRLLAEMGDSPERNQAIVRATEMGIAQGEQVLVMSHRREHCRVLDAMLVAKRLKTGFMLGGDDVAFEETRLAFEKQTIDVAVGTFQAIGFAIDLPKAAVVVCATPIASNKQFFNQVRGRVCRSAKGKTDSWLYYLWDAKLYGVMPLKNLMKWNRKRVVVWQDGKWVSAKDFLLAARAA